MEVEVQNWPAFAAATALIGLEFSSTFHAEAELVMAVVWTVALLLSVVVAMRRSLGASG